MLMNSQNVKITIYHLCEIILVAVEARGANPFKSNNNFYVNILIYINFLYC